MFTLVQDRERDQDPLFPIVQVPFPVPPQVPVWFSVNNPYLQCSSTHQHFLNIPELNSSDKDTGISALSVIEMPDIENMPPTN